MEVHHHSHDHPKKGWKAYFWEFLMLFFAVSAGFLVENQREHYIEHQREKLLAKNLYTEILGDSVSIRQKLSMRELKEKGCADFILFVKDSSLTSLSPRFYPAFTWAFIQIQTMLFEPNDGILNQLKNSGELRYFKNAELQIEIGRLNVMIANVRYRNDKEYSFLEENIRPFSLKHYDFNWYQAITQNGKMLLLEAQKQLSALSYSGKIVNADQFNRQEAENLASYYLLMLRGTRQIQYADYIKSNHRLLEILRNQYDVE
jgi:hypothetical protein